MPRSLQNALILFFLYAPAVHAAGLACESAASLRVKVKDCEGNLAYAQAGKKCLDDFDTAVAERREKVAKALGEMVAADQQTASMDNAKKGYQAAAADLDSLASEGKRLAAEVEAYKKEVVFPEDFGAAGRAGLEPEEFLRGQKCYSSTRKLVESYSELLRLHSKELELTKVLAEGLAAKAFRGEKGLKPEEFLPLLSGPKANGSGKAEPPKAGGGKSDVTGTNPAKK